MGANDIYTGSDIANILAAVFIPEEGAAVFKKLIAVGRGFGLQPQDWVPAPLWGVIVELDGPWLAIDDWAGRGEDG